MPGSPGPSPPTDRIIGNAAVIGGLRAQILRLAPFDDGANPHVPTVLLQGETGTGKGLIARVIHDSGPRRAGPFVDVNCAAIPDALLESELFGFEPGAFTDAKHPKPGLFEVASGGTLFLDEIEALPLPLQGKLLKVIEDKRARRLGAVRDVEINVKLIAATQADLHAWVGERRFRTDLYHRLAVVLLHVPLLRDRGDDVLLLARQFLRRHAAAYGLAAKTLSAGAEDWLRRHPWPGNVRELSHLVERLTLLSTEPVIDLATIERYSLRASEPAALATDPSPEGRDMGAHDAERIRQALIRTGGNVVRAARLLGLSRGALRHRMARHGVELVRDDDLEASLPAVASTSTRDEENRRGSSLTSPESREAPPAPGVSEWERKPVCVLVVEVTCSADAGDHGRPHEPWTIARRWQRVIRDTVDSFGGVILQRSPSLVLAVFGIPGALEQLPQRALQAALALRRWTTEATAVGGDAVGLTLRQGVHWGEMLVVADGPEAATRSLPVGDVLARPVRLLAHAAAGEILLSHDMGHVVEGQYELRARPGVTVASAAGIEVYSLVGLRMPRSPIVMHGSRPLSRFVGRKREMESLAAALAQTSQGHGRIVAIIGEPGVGKSRLAWEIAHSSRTDGWLVVEAACVSYAKTTPYFPVADLLRTYFHIEDRDGLRDVRKKAAEKLLAVDEALKPILPAICAMLDAPLDDDSRWKSLDSRKRRAESLEAVKRLLLRESQAQPVLMVAEDLHWMDSETQALLDTLVESLPAARVMLLVTYRPEYRHDWGGKTYYVQLPLGPLPLESAARLLDDLLGGHPSVEHLKTSLVERTEGNPFFLEEIVRTLAETKALEGVPGDYRLIAASAAVALPQTIQAVLDARIDRLSGIDKRVLQTASAIGTQIPFPILARVSDVPVEAVRGSLTQLQHAEFLYETRLYPELEYTFKHALTHEATYQTLSHDRRRALHGSIIEAIEIVYADRLGEHVERLAYHAVEAQQWDRAVDYLRAAATKAFARSALQESLQFSERALAVLPHLPETPENTRRAIDVRLDLHGPLFVQHQVARLRQVYREAEQLARQLNDEPRLARICYRLGNYSHQSGQHGDGIAYAEEVLRIATAMGDAETRILGHYLLGILKHTTGEHRAAIELLLRNVDGPDADLARQRLGVAFGSPYLLSCGWLATALVTVGDFARALRYGQDGLSVADVSAQPQAQAFMYYRVAGALARKGDFAQALTLTERLVRTCEANDVVLFLGLAYASHGWVLAWLGRTVEGLPLLERGPRVSADIGAKDHLAGLFLLWAEGLMLARKTSEARAVAEQSLELAVSRGARGSEATALQVLAAVASEGPVEGQELACSRYEQALALGEPLGMRPLVAHCHSGLAKLAARTGKRDLAQHHLAAATTMYRQMDMQFWLEKAQTEARAELP